MCAMDFDMKQIEYIQTLQVYLRSFLLFILIVFTFYWTVKKLKGSFRPV